MINTPNTQNKTTQWKKILKKLGIGGVIFFTIKGIITSALLYFLGKNFWEVIKNYIYNLF